MYKKHSITLAKRSRVYVSVSELVIGQLKVVTFRTIVSGNVQGPW